MTCDATSPRAAWLIITIRYWENHSMLPPVSIDILTLFPMWQCSTRSKWHKQDLVRRCELQKTQYHLNTSSSSNLKLAYTLQKSTNPISWYVPFKSRSLIKSIAGGYSYAEGTAADFEATCTMALWSGRWRLHRTATAGKMWFLFLKLSRHASKDIRLWKSFDE